MEFKIRLMRLNKKQIELVGEIRERAKIKLDPTEFSTYINHPTGSPKCDLVLKAANEILGEWEEK